MGRFDAVTAADRRTLIVDALRAHRERESAFLTLEVDPVVADPPPWIQFDAHDRVANLDVADAEWDRLTSLIDDFGGCRVRERHAPEDASGTNVRLELRVDDERVGQFIERCFRSVYDLPSDYRLWVADL